MTPVRMDKTRPYEYWLTTTNPMQLEQAWIFSIHSILIGISRLLSVPLLKAYLFVA